MFRAMKLTVVITLTVIGLAAGARSAINSGLVDEWIDKPAASATPNAAEPEKNNKPGRTTTPPSTAPAPKTEPKTEPKTAPKTEPKRTGTLWNEVTLTPAKARKALGKIPTRAPHSMSGYSRDLFPHWNDATTWGWTDIALPYEDCDVRAAALIRDGKKVSTNEYCTVKSGVWRSPYDDSTETDPSEVDGDHMVPLANAWRSGADEWSEQKATKFANDPLVVLAAPAALNSSKGDRGPESWKPARASWCGYAVRWIEVKAKYGLALTSKSERATLRTMLATCQNGTNNG